MGQDIVGSKQPTFASDQVQSSTRGYGQNGSAVSPSQKPGALRAISKNFSDVAPPAASANPGDWQTRKISAAPLKPAFAQKSPNSPVKIPMSLNRGTVVQPAKAGNAKR
jgi:hypothetical protein